MRRGTVVVLGFVAMVLAPFAWAWVRRNGVVGSVRNDETFVLRDVEVRTTAGAYSLGDLAPGESAATAVGALGGSSMQVAWTPEDGAQRTVAADTYFEGSRAGVDQYRGAIEFVIRDGTAQVSGQIDLGLSPFTRAVPPPQPTEESLRRTRK